MKSVKQKSESVNRLSKSGVRQIVIEENHSIKRNKSLVSTAKRQGTAKGVAISVALGMSANLKTTSKE